MKLEQILTSSLLQLSKVNRYSGVYLIQPESVSDHTTQVGLIAFTLASYLKHIGEEIDLGRVALYALLHDIDESLTGDIPRNIKYYNSKSIKSFNEIAEDAINRLDAQLGFTNIHDYWVVAKEDGIEGLIVGISDVLQVVRKIIEEVQFLGNKYMLHVALEVSSNAKTLKDSIVSAEISFPAERFLTETIDDAWDVLESILDDNRDIIEKFNIRDRSFGNVLSERKSTYD